MAPTPISAYAKDRFTGPVGAHEATFDVYRRGAGPAIVLMQEMPGIGQEVLALCDRLVDAGFEVRLPHWFGPIGRTDLAGNFGRVLCMRREFDMLARDRSSPIVDWMRALCRHIGEETGRSRIGVMGMCLSGNFALALIAEANVWAAVASQPSLPVLRHDAVHMAPGEIAAARAAIDAKGSARAWRFAGDKICTAARFDAIARSFDDGKVRVITRTLAGRGHSVFALDYDATPGTPTAEAMAELIAYFKDRLVTA
jgi:dienelactone hydrolase